MSDSTETTPSPCTSPRRFDPSAVPIAVHSDSYKFTHPEMYPPARAMSAYIEARRPFEGGDDHRVVHYGTRYLVERWLMRRWTHADVDAAEAFFATFNAGHTPHPVPKDLLARVVDEHDGWFPVTIDALPDGSVVYARTPQLVITAEGDFARLVTWLETVALQTIWYMSTVATHSRLTVSAIRDAFERSADPDAFWKLGSRLHDFGFRGCTSAEQAIMGGSAHLLNSDGTDTTVAAWYATHHLNGGRPIGSSIPATEHSVMTAWPTELGAVERVVDRYGAGVFATVADSYDYAGFLAGVVPAVAPRVKAKGGFHVVRPDSGDPVQCVVDGLRALERAYGATTNGRGFKVIDGAGVIQGDGIDRHVVAEILEAAMAAGYSAENCAFGMGAGLLQRLNRDTLGYACKLSWRQAPDGAEHDVMKVPRTDDAKASLPGRLDVVPAWFDREQGVPMPQVWPLDESPGGSMLHRVWDRGPVDGVFESFDDVRARVEREWRGLPPQAPLPVWSEALQARRAEVIAGMRARPSG